MRLLHDLRALFQVSVMVGLAGREEGREAGEECSIMLVVLALSPLWIAPPEEGWACLISHRRRLPLGLHLLTELAFVCEREELLFIPQDDVIEQVDPEQVPRPPEARCNQFVIPAWGRIPAWVVVSQND